MLEFTYLMALVHGRPDHHKFRPDRSKCGLLALPLLGCVLNLIVGCSSFPTQQVVPDTVIHAPAPPLERSKWASQEGESVASSPRESKAELHIPDHPAIDTWVNRFSGEKHRTIQAQLDRAHPYVAPAQQVFKQQGLPIDLIYVALVESGFSPTARSHADAVGMWQFIAATGKRFRLEQNRWVDERRHPLKAARAAAEYLSLLHKTFGSWPLALAAYNAGENAVSTALDQSGLQTFWQLRDKGLLPGETRDYVPKVLAAIKIVRNPASYGFYLEPPGSSAKHETVVVPGGVKLAWLGEQIGVPEPTLRSSNPELSQSITPPGTADYELHVPLGKGKQVMTALATRSMQDLKPSGNRNDSLRKSSDTDKPSIYKVKTGDTWTSLAAKMGCNPKTLTALNGLNASRPLKAGQTLKTPYKTKYAKAVVQPAGEMPTPEKKNAASSPSNKLARTAQKACQPRFYPVRPGDSLWTIAERFGTSVENLRTHNEQDRIQKLTPGKVLTICTREQDTTDTARRRKN